MSTEVRNQPVPDTTDAEDTLWAIRTVGEFIQEEIDARSSVVGEDQAEYRDAPRVAYTAFNLLRAAAIRNEIRDAKRQPPEFK